MLTTQKFTYKRQQKLKSKKLTDELFASGKVVQQYPLKCFYLQKEDDDFLLQAGVGVSKRYFKKAVHRNRIKRLLREAFRLNKHLLSETVSGKHVALFFLYVDKELPTFEFINEKVKNIFTALAKKLNGPA